MDALKLILDILKFGAIGVGSISGLIGTLTETKDKESGKPTPWGKRIVRLIVLSAVIALTIQSIETYLKHQSDAQDAHNRLEAANKTSMILDKANQTATDIQATKTRQEALLTDLQRNVEKTDQVRQKAEEFGLELKNQRESIDKTVTGIAQTAKGLSSVISEQYRVMQPIDSISVFVFALVLPMDQAPLDKYKDRLNSGIAQFLATVPVRNQPGLSVPATKEMNGVSIPTTVEVEASHPLFPQYGAESLSRQILSVDYMELAFYKRRRDPAGFRPFTHGSNDEPDLRIDFFNRKMLGLNKSLEDGRFYLQGLFDSPEKRLWENNTSEIVAIPDLVSAQLFISFGPLGTEHNDETFHRVRQEFSLDSLKISFANRGLWIKTSQLHKHVSKNGTVFWEFLFPKTPTELFPAAGY